MLMFFWGGEDEAVAGVQSNQCGLVGYRIVVREKRDK